MTSRPAAPELETPETDALDLQYGHRKEIFDAYRELARSLERRLSLAQTEIKGHMRDAARYRWLRECSVTRSDRTIYVMHNLYTNGLFLRSDYPSQDRLDAAIDAALKSRA